MIYSSEFIPTDQPVNTELAKEWAIPLTSGGTSICYKCYHHGRLYFQKALRKEYLDNQRYRAIFRKEYAIGSSLDCPYIVKYHDLQDTDTDCCLTEDYIEGDTLDQLLLKYPWFFKKKATLDKFVNQLLEALRYLHERQIIHMDINPSNIMITAKTNDIKIIDLGFCYSDSYQDTVGYTRGFSAQELYDKSYDYDVRTDIYSVGLILQYIKDNSQSSLPPKYRYMKSCCLKKDKNKRYQSVTEIQNYLKGRSYLDRILMTAVFLAFLIFIFFYFDGPRHIHHSIYGYDFTDKTGLQVDILSDDSLICSIKGYDISKDKENDRVETWQIVIPEKISYGDKDYEVRDIGDEAFKGNTSIKMLTILSKKITIGNAAFMSCKNLHYVTFGDGDVTLMPNSFANLKKLKTFDFPSSLTTIPYICFTGSQLKTLNLPDGLTKIEQDAFVGNDSLTTVHLPYTLGHLGRGVFYHNTNLREVHIPASVHSIGMFCFMDCPHLKCIYNEAVRPQHVTDIFDKNVRITVYVPRPSIDKYRAADVWKDQDIQPIE